MNQFDSNASFEIETLQDWHLEAGANQDVPVETGASNSNTSNNSATEP
jgi:hypothetical protein